MPRKLPGIRRHGAGWQAYVRVNGQLFTRQYPITATAEEMRDWRADTKHAEKKKRRPVTRGTLAADVVLYLKTLEDRPRLQKERRHHLRWWCERFGHRRRSSLERGELIAALAALVSHPIARRSGPHVRSASNRKKYRTALFHLFTTLDGKDAPNPLRDIPPPREPDPEPRWIPPMIIEAILDAMPDRGQAKRHQTRPTISKTKARLYVQYDVGLAPAQIMALQPATDINWEEPSVIVRGRQKGQGGRTKRLPLTPRGVRALQRLVAAKATGRFSVSALDKCFKRGVQAMVDRLAATDFRLAREFRQLLLAMKVRPYDLRHTFLTEAQLAGGDIKATQELATHSDIRQTMRYTLAAVDPRLKAVAAQLAARADQRPTLGSLTAQRR